MAESKKGSSAQRKTAQKQSSDLVERRRAEMIKENEQRRHRISIIMFAAGLLVLAFALIGNTHSEAPSAWDAIHSFVYGMFGIVSFLVGPILMYIAVMISADTTRATIQKRMVQLILLVLLLSAAAQVFFVGTIGDPEKADANLFDTIGYIYGKGVDLQGGGVIGLILGALLLVFGQIGAIIILIIVTFVAIMIMTEKSLIDFVKTLFSPIKKASGYVKEKSAEVREAYEYAEPERQRREEEKKLLRLEQKEQKQAERNEKRELAKLNEEEKRRRKFEAIANVTTNAQREVTSDDKKEAAEKEKEVPNPVADQKKESAKFQQDLNDILKGRLDRVKEPVQQTVDNVVIEKPAPGGPYSPDGPFFAGESTSAEKQLNPVVKHDSLINPNNREPENFNSTAVFFDPNHTANENIPEQEAPVQTSPSPAESSSEESKNETPAVIIPPAEVNPEPTSETPETESTDIVDAINEFKREQDERAKAAEENERILGTVIKTDENGQTHISEVVAESEQYTLPPCEILDDIIHERSDEAIKAEVEQKGATLVNALKSFGVETTFIGYSRGPSVTRYELQPAPGVKISKITGLVDDIALNLATAGVRIEAPIPNKAAVGIEVPNRKIDSVPFREMVDSKEFRETASKLGSALGRSITGEIVIADIAKMPHILIAGTTGSGKSVCVNSIIMSILFRSTPEEVRLLMIDPKAVEFMIYNGIPHLLIPVVTDPKKAAGALSWAVTEMEQRYKLFSENSVKDLAGYNKLAKTRDDLSTMPQIVIFIDELADLMMTSPGEVEDSICRIAQKARAAGMHLVIATQRPSVNVVTGVIKANIPSRIALKVASQVDSRTILDSSGAEKLIGRGDMLYFPVNEFKPIRVQGCWVSEKEIERVADFIKNSFILDYDESVIAEIEKQAELAAQKAEKGSKRDSDDDDGPDLNDDKLDEAIEAVIEAGQASTSYLQRKLKLGYGRAARLIDTMESLGVVGPYEGSKPRQVIMTKQDWYERKLHKED